MFLRFKNSLYNKTIYWQLRTKINSSFGFSYWRKAFRIRSDFHEERISASLLWTSMPSVMGNIFFACLFVISVEGFNYFSKLNIPLNASKEALTTFLATIVTVCGVFLGLYFTAVSAVAGSLFIRATEDLQALFIREKQGKQYIRSLVLTIVVGIIYLLFNSFGISIRPLGPILVAFLAAYAVIRFMSLGSQIFYFVHPIQASGTITGDAARAITGATVSGFRWTNPTFQNHFKKQADRALTTMRNLIDFGIETAKLSDQQLVDMTKYVSGLLHYYMECKKSIPSESLWYKDKSQFQNVIVADSIEVTLALNTGTSLAPKMIKDKTWFEEDCIDICLKMLSIFLGKQDWGSAQACLETLVSVAEGLGPDLYEDSSRLLVNKIESVIKQASLLKPSTLNENEGQLAFVDSLGRVPISLLIGFSKYVVGQTHGQLDKDIRRIKWLSKTGIYRAPLPGALLSSLESTVKSLRTEYRVQGKALSPKWYLVNISVQQYLFAVKKYYDFLKSLHGDYFRRNVERFIGDGQILLAAHLCQRWLEYVNKLSNCVSMVEKHVLDCGSFRKAKDLPWVKLNFNEEHKVAREWTKEAEDRLIALLPKLVEYSQNRNDEIPDYFGQAYVFGVEACFQACADNDTKRYSEIFPKIFDAAITAYGSILKELKEYPDYSKIMFSSEPLEDLLELSGYAQLYSELYENKDMRETCEKVWTNYLSNVDAKQVIGFISAMSDYRDTSFSLMPRSIVRTNWDLQFRSKLKEMNLLTDPYDYHLRTQGAENLYRHPSPLIRVIGRRGYMLSVDSRAVFFVTYLGKHPGAEGVNLKDNRDIRRRLDEEIKKSKAETTSELTDEDTKI